MYNAVDYQEVYNNFAMSQQQPLLTSSGPNSTMVRTADFEDPERMTYNKGRRVRTAFTELQLMELEREFEQREFIHRTRRVQIAKCLDLNEAQIKVWFQNRRIKSRKAHGSDIKTLGTGYIVERSLMPFEPVEKEKRPFADEKVFKIPVDIQNKLSGEEGTTPSVGTKLLPVIKPLLAKVLTNPLDIEHSLPGVLKNRTNLTIRNQAARVFKPHVMIKMPVAHEKIDSTFHQVQEQQRKTRSSTLDVDVDDLISTLEQLIDETTNSNRTVPPYSMDQVMDTYESVDLNEFVFDSKELEKSHQQQDEPLPAVLNENLVIDDFSPTPIVTFSFKNVMDPDSKPIVTVSF